MFNINEYRTSGGAFGGTSGGGKRLSDFLPWAALIRPGVVLNKDGSFMSVVKFRGPDLDSASDHELIAARARLNNTLRRLGSRWCLHVESNRRPSRAYPESNFPDPVTAAIEHERRERFEADEAHFESTQYLALTYLPPEERTAGGRSLFIESGAESIEGKAQSLQRTGFDYRQELDGFCRQVRQIADLLRGFMPEAKMLQESDLLTYLHGCISTRSLRVAVPPTPFYLDELLTDDELAGGFEPRLGDHYLQTVSVRAYAQRTTPGLLDALHRLPMGCRWVVRWLPMDKADAEKRIGSIRRQWFAKRKGLLSLVKEAVTKEASELEDSDSVNKAQDADEALQYLGSDLCSYGYLTLTITVADHNPQRAWEKAAAVQQIVDSVGLVSKVETVNAVEAWLGSLPGHAYADVRRPIIGSLNLCDLIPLSAVWSGPVRCEHLDGPPLLMTRTSGSTPFRLDLFQGDVGHTMVCGPTGAGKSTLLNLLAAQWRRYSTSGKGQVYIFDKGGSCKAITLAVGGDYYDLGAADSSGASGGDEQGETSGGTSGGGGEGGLSFQPLGRVHEEAERSWAQQWLLDILDREGVATNPQLKEEIWRTLELLGSDYEIHDRTLSSFVNLVQDAPVKEAMRRYTLAGPYGRLLDAHSDNLDAGTWQAFETEHLMRNPAAMIPVLTYLFHRLEDRFASRPPGTPAPGSDEEQRGTSRGSGGGASGGGGPTLLILDEAWVFLSQGFFARKINEWLKVLRKRNVAVVFATQSLADIRDSEIAPALIENCPTRLFLPNPRALEPTVRTTYESFGLTESQLRILSTAVPKRDYYYQSRDGNRLFELDLGPLALAFCAAGSPADQALADKLIRSHPRDQFAHRYLLAKDLIPQAQVLIALSPPETPEAASKTSAAPKSSRGGGGGGASPLTQGDSL